MRVLRALLQVVALVALAAGVLSARQWRVATSAMERSDAAFDQGELIGALSEARRAASAYAPGIIEVRAAFQRMVAIATGAEETGDRALAIRAWRTVRASAISLRHFWSPFEEEEHVAQQRLTVLDAGRIPRVERRQEQKGEGTAAVQGGAQRSAFGSIWVVLSLLATASGLGWASWKGLDAGGRWRANPGLWGLVLAIAGVASWTLAAYPA